MERKSIHETIMQLAGQYNDLEFELPHKLCERYNYIKDIGFLIITPDAVKRGITNEIIDYLKKVIKVKFCLAKVKHLTTRDIEILYKYSMRRKILEGEPSYWWLMEKCLQVGPCIGILLYSDNYEDEYFCDTLVKIKGKYVGENPDSSYTIREKFKSFSRLFNTIHCSDDIFNVLRESMIFFNEEEIDNAMKNISRSYFLKPSEISNLVRGGEILSGDLKKITDDINVRILAALNIKIKMFNDKNSDNVFMDYMNCLTYGDFIVTITDLCYDEDFYNLVNLLYIINGKGNVPLSKVENFIDSTQLYFSPFEKLIILNIATFKKWTKYEVATSN